MDYRDRFNADRFSGAVWINLLAGLWLIASPWIYGFFAPGAPSAWNSIVVGILIALVAGARLGSGIAGAGLSWVNAVLGAWTIASPFVYGYSGDAAPTANSIIVGVIVLIVGLSALPGEATGYPSSWGYWPYGYAGWGYPPLGAGWSPREARGNFRGRGPRGYQRSDAQIKDAICERMADSPDLDASDIDIVVTAGVVTLQGSVPTRESKRLADDLADSVSGVHDVRNELRVAGIAREAPRRVA